MSGVVKSGLVVGFFAFTAALGVSAFYISCLVPLFCAGFGVAAGILAVRWSGDDLGLKRVNTVGAQAGAIAGAAAMIGSAVGLTVVFGPLGGSEAVIEMVQDWFQQTNLALPSQSDLETQARLALLMNTSCIGIANVVMSTIFGSFSARRYDQSRQNRV